MISLSSSSLWDRKSAINEQYHAIRVFAFASHGRVDCGLLGMGCSGGGGMVGRELSRGGPEHCCLGWCKVAMDQSRRNKKGQRRRGGGGGFAHSFSYDLIWSEKEGEGQ